MAPIAFLRYSFNLIKRAVKEPIQTLYSLRDNPNVVKIIIFNLIAQKLALERDDFIAFVTRESKPRIVKLFEELRISDFFQELTKKIQPIWWAKITPVGRITPGLIGIEKGLVLYVIIRYLRPRYVVETGVANGGSSAFILKALEMNNCGHLYSIDLPPKKGEIYADGISYYIPKDRNIGWLVPTSIQHRWTLILEPAEDALPRLLQQLGTINVFLHDSLHTYNHMMFEYSTAWAHLQRGGVLLTDDFGYPFMKLARNVSRSYAHYSGLGGIIK